MGTTTKVFNDFMPYCADRGHVIPEGYNAKTFGYDMRDMPGWDRVLRGSKWWTMRAPDLENYLLARNKLSRKRRAPSPPDSDDES